MYKIRPDITSAKDEVNKLLENITNHIARNVSYKMENIFNTSLSFCLLIIKLTDKDTKKIIKENFSNKNEPP